MITTVEPGGQIGVDVNERNVTTSDTGGTACVHDTSQIADIKERYRIVRARNGRRTRQDNRVGAKLYAKHGGREKKNRTIQRINVI